VTSTTTAYLRAGDGIDGLAFRDAAVPDPGVGEALVRLRAATLNYRDLLMADGALPGLAREPDYVPLSCATGEVIAVGEGVTRVGVGDRVNPLFSQGWIDGPPDPERMLGGKADGVARAIGVFPAESLLRVPDALGDMEAATLPCAGLTAWSALTGPRPVRPGEWVLVQGTGGVAMAALQWAKALGANVVVLSSSDAKLARARALGADLAVNYRDEPDWATAVRRARGGAGVDLVVDSIGQGGRAMSVAVLDEGGVLAAIGRLDGAFSWDVSEEGGRRVAPITVGNRAAHEAMLAFAAERAIRPVVDTVYDLPRLGDAMRHLASGRFFGKIGINLL
jgi:NADPH:quinone reductase-like Zn-dependent oxidoreductase